MSDAYISVALRREIVERAKNCCEYCRLSQNDHFFNFHVDHIISEKHQGQTISDNLCLSCVTCNINKGSDIAGFDPHTNELSLLYNPRQQNWDEHFELEDAHIIGKTSEGRLTVQLLQMNIKERVAERKGLIGLGRYPC